MSWLRVWCDRCHGTGVVYVGSSTTITRPCGHCESIGYRFVPAQLVTR